MLDPLVVTTVSVGFGLLFLLGAVHKLTGIAEFRAILDDYRILPAGLVAPTAVGVGVIEGGLGAAWLFTADKSVTAIATASLLGAGRPQPGPRDRRRAGNAAGIRARVRRTRLLHAGDGAGCGGAAVRGEQPAHPQSRGYQRLATEGGAR